MFTFLKLIIWIVGLFVVSAFVLNYFGYEINRDYFKESKIKCRNLMNQCAGKLIRQGIENAECDFNCVDLKFIIKKK